MASLITKKFSIVEVIGSADIALAGVGVLAGNAAKIYGPSLSTGASRQSFTPGVGGTLQTLKPGFGYEVVSTSTSPSWDFPGIRVLYGGSTPAPVAPTIGNFSPQSGTAGITVLVTGNNLGATAGTARIGNVAASVVSWSDTSVTITAPALGTGPITLVTAAGVTLTTPTAFTLTVPAAGTKVQVLVDGDSLEESQGASGPTTTLTARLQARLDSSVYGGFQMFANSGQTSTQMLNDQGAVFAAKNTTDYNRYILYVGSGINSLAGYFITPQTAAQLFATMKQYHQAAHAAGFQTIAATLTACNKSYGIGRDPLETVRLQYNNLVRSGWKSDWGASGFVDLGADTNLGILRANTDTTYFDGDGQHFNDFGYDYKAGLIKPAFDAVAAGNTYGVETVVQTSGDGDAISQPPGTPKAVAFFNQVGVSANGNNVVPNAGAFGAGAMGTQSLVYGSDVQYLSWTISHSDPEYVAGLNSGPNEGSSYEELEYSWHVVGPSVPGYANGGVRIFGNQQTSNSGGTYAGLIPFADGDTLQIIRNPTTGKLIWAKNWIQISATTQLITTPLFPDCSFKNAATSPAGWRNVFILAASYQNAPGYVNNPSGVLRRFVASSGISTDTGFKWTDTVTSDYLKTATAAERKENDAPFPPSPEAPTVIANAIDGKPAVQMRGALVGNAFLGLVGNQPRVMLIVYKILAESGGGGYGLVSTGATAVANTGHMDLEAFQGKAHIFAHNGSYVDIKGGVSLPPNNTWHIGRVFFDGAQVSSGFDSTMSPLEALDLGLATDSKLLVGGGHWQGFFDPLIQIAEVIVRNDASLAQQTQHLAELRAAYPSLSQ